MEASQVEHQVEVAIQSHLAKLRDVAAVYGGVRQALDLAGGAIDRDLDEVHSGRRPPMSCQIRDLIPGSAPQVERPPRWQRSLALDQLHDLRRRDARVPRGPTRAIEEPVRYGPSHPLPPRGAGHAQDALHHSWKPLPRPSLIAAVTEPKRRPGTSTDQLGGEFSRGGRPRRLGPTRRGRDTRFRSRAGGGPVARSASSLNGDSRGVDDLLGESVGPLTGSPR